MSAVEDTPEYLAELKRLRDLQLRASALSEATAEGFVSACLIVEKETGALIPFALWPLQREALTVILREDKLVMPKGRQVGVTHLELAAMLWAGSQHGHRLFPIARQSQEYAQDAITRLIILAGYDPNSTPPDMRVLPESPMPEAWRPKIVAKTAMSLTLSNGSHYRALTATQQIGRGLAAYWGLADEAAFWPWPSQQVAAMEAGCARLHVVSTGAGEGDFFHALYQQAVDGKGDYFPLFVPSTADIRRDDEWYRRAVDEAADENLARREHARTAEDAFRAPEGVYFSRFTRERNVMAAKPQASWKTWRGADFGYRHPACLWAQLAPTGQPFIVGELAPESLTTDEFRDAILAMDKTLGVHPRESYCDPAGKAVNVQTAESEFEILRRGGLRPKGKPSSVRDGCVRIMNALSDKQLPLIVSDSCPELIRCLTQVKPDKSRPDLYDQREDSPYQHLLDALRYIFVNAHLAKGGGGGSVGYGAGTRRTGF